MKYNAYNQFNVCFFFSLLLSLLMEITIVDPLQIFKKSIKTIRNDVLALNE